MPNVLSVDPHQVIKDLGHQVMLAHPLKEGGVIRAGVRGEKDACVCAGEVVARVEDEAGGAVSDTLPSIDSLRLPETVTKTEDHLGGAGVMNRAQGFHLVSRKRGQEVDEEGSFGCGRNQNIVHS